MIPSPEHTERLGLVRAGAGERRKLADSVGAAMIPASQDVAVVANPQGSTTRPTVIEFADPAISSTQTSMDDVRRRKEGQTV